MLTQARALSRARDTRQLSNPRKTHRRTAVDDVAVVARQFIELLAYPDSTTVMLVAVIIESDRRHRQQIGHWLLVLTAAGVSDVETAQVDEG